MGNGTNWYIYGFDNPLYYVDPEGYGGVWIGGLHLGDDRPWLAFDAGSAHQLAMSAKATASGVITGMTMGALSPDWRDPCDPYGSFSRNMGIGSGVLLSVVATNPQQMPFARFYKYYNPRSPSKFGPWLTRGYRGPPHAVEDAQRLLSLEHKATRVQRVKVPWSEYVKGGTKIEGHYGQPGGGWEWFRPNF